MLAELVKDRSQRIKIIFISGYSSESIDGLAKSHGMAKMVRHVLDTDSD